MEPRLLPQLKAFLLALGQLKNCSDKRQYSVTRPPPRGDHHVWTHHSVSTSNFRLYL